MPGHTTFIQQARREGYKGTNKQEAQKYLEDKKNEGDAPNYGPMKKENKGGGTNYFSMNYMANKNNAQDANTISTFKDPGGVAMAGGTSLNDGHMNYGTPVNHETGKEHKHQTEEEKKNTAAGAVNAPQGTNDPVRSSFRLFGKDFKFKIKT